MTVLILKEKLLFEKWQVFQDYNDKFGEKVTQKYVRLLKNNPKLNVKRENATENAVLMKSVIENKFSQIQNDLNFTFSKNSLEKVSRYTLVSRYV